MQINYQKAEQIILKAYPDSIVVAGMKGKDGYIFSIRPRNWEGDLLSPFFKVSFNDGTLTEYSPVMAPEEFKDAMRNPIYLMNKK